MQQEKQKNIIVEPQVDLQEFPMENVKIMPFDEITVGYLKDMQEQNNIYIGLRNQEEQMRVNLNQIKKAIHEIKRMNAAELNELSFPYLAGYRRVTMASRDEFVKANINVYRSMENQYKALHAQRLHRGDEYGEARMRVLKRLYTIAITENDFDQEELNEMLNINRDNPLVRPKNELPVEIKVT